MEKVGIVETVRCVQHGETDMSDDDDDLGYLRLSLEVCLVGLVGTVAL